MLGILITYHSFFELLPFQIKNIRHFVKVPFQILIVDDSETDNSLLVNQCSEVGVHYWKIPEAQQKQFGFHPSARHQNAVNTGLEILRENCDQILLFDNDMFFVKPFNPSSEQLEELWIFPQTRGVIMYPWLNLMLFSAKETFTIDFATCPVTGESTDSGGSLWTFLESKKESIHFIEQTFSSDEFFVGWQEKYRHLCASYSIAPWYDLFTFLDTTVFHFRGLSNWQRHPVEFLEAKKQLILTELRLFQNTYLPETHC